MKRMLVATMALFMVGCDESKPEVDSRIRVPDPRLQRVLEQVPKQGVTVNLVGPAFQPAGKTDEPSVFTDLLDVLPKVCSLKPGPDGKVDYSQGYRPSIDGSGFRFEWKKADGTPTSQDLRFDLKNSPYATGLRSLFKNLARIAKTTFVEGTN